MSTRDQDTNFGRSFLDDVADWIGSHMDPEDVFSEDSLAAWAESNGYVKESRE